MNKLLLLCILLFSICTSGYSQINDTHLRQTVLEKNIPDSLFVFGKWSENGQTETHLKYLGSVTTKNKKVLKILTSTWIWGLSQRATNRILIFNNKNQYVGEYSVGIIDDLPKKLKNGNLIFINSDFDECDPKAISKIDLNNGLPKEIFVECKNGSGDIYKFYTN